MRFLLDENFPKAAGSFLQNAGHESFDFRGSGEEGMEDSAVFEKAQALRAVLLTTDRDFFHTIPHLFETHAGVIVVALRQPNRVAILSRLEWVLSNVEESAFANRAFQLRDKTWLVYPSLG
jgi:predicted nuclease of predicted toxin-antitoxin system